MAIRANITMCRSQLKTMKKFISMDLLKAKYFRRYRAYLIMKRYCNLRIKNKK